MRTQPCLPDPARPGWARLYFIENHSQASREIVIILPFVADVDVNDDVTGIDQRREGLRVERSIEHVAVLAPVAAEDDDHALAFVGGSRQTHFQFRFRLSRIGIQVHVRNGRLRESARRFSQENSAC